MIRGSVAKNDLQLKASYVSSPPCAVPNGDDSDDCIARMEWVHIFKSSAKSCWIYYVNTYVNTLKFLYLAIPSPTATTLMIV